MCVGIMCLSIINLFNRSHGVHVHVHVLLDIVAAHVLHDCDADDALHEHEAAHGQLLSLDTESLCAPGISLLYTLRNSTIIQ